MVGIAWGGSWDAEGSAAARRIDCDDWRWRLGPAGLSTAAWCRNCPPGALCNKPGRLFVNCGKHWMVYIFALYSSCTYLQYFVVVFLLC